MSDLFEKEWTKIAERLGLAVLLGKEIELSNGQLVRVPVLLLEFGSKRGMLLFSSSKQVEGKARQIAEDGFGYSILSEPSEDSLENIDWDSVIEMLNDWGWSGRSDEVPEWYQGESLN